MASLVAQTSDSSHRDEFIKEKPEPKLKIKGEKMKAK
jgi:hypothetical protein